MTIKIIEIEYIKGISKFCFGSDILPNKPSILVAPNGFGKSSFAYAFALLQADKLTVRGYLCHRLDVDKRPRIFIRHQDADNTILDLEATDSSNEIRDKFDCFVINSQINAKGTGVNYGSELTIEPVALISNFPEKAKFKYSPKSIRSIFGINSKVLPNITELLSNSVLIKNIYANISILDKLLESQTQQHISEFIQELNHQSGTVLKLLNWIEEYKLEALISISPLNDLMLLLHGPVGLSSKAECFLAAIQLIYLYKSDTTNFKKACQYKIYELKKQDYRHIFNTFNRTWRDIHLERSGSQLIVKFPEYHCISNGERDTLSFIALLEQARNNLNKDNNILIIDEIFDYLDEANLVIAQYYVTQLIEEYKILGRKIYPLILTHLDPAHFKNYTFSKQKVYYLDKSDLIINPNLVNLLIKREERLIKDDVSKYLLHYHPFSINKKAEFKQLSLKETWGEGNNFNTFIDAELQNYLDEKANYDPFAVCCGLRKKIENLVYKKIQDDTNKKKFLDIHKTRKKLEFAESIGVEVPEVYYLLGIIYNDGMHWKHNEDNVSNISIIDPEN